TKPSKILCNCLNVSENTGCAGIARGLDLNGLQHELKCGTSCGSCVPEIRRLPASRQLAVCTQIYAPRRDHECKSLAGRRGSRRSGIADAQGGESVAAS